MHVTFSGFFFFFLMLLLNLPLFFFFLQKIRLYYSYSNNMHVHTYKIYVIQYVLLKRQSIKLQCMVKSVQCKCYKSNLTIRKQTFFSPSLLILYYHLARKHARCLSLRVIICMRHACSFVYVTSHRGTPLSAVIGAFWHRVLQVFIQLYVSIFKVLVLSHLSKA